MASRTRSAEATAAVLTEVIRVSAAATAPRRRAGAPADTEILAALANLRALQVDLAALEPTLIAAARQRGVSWQTLAPVLGVASRQAAERRYLRLRPAVDESGPATRDGRVLAERDRRAGDKAVGRWANRHTAELRGLAGQIAALTDLDTAVAVDLSRLHRALGDRDATALPRLLANTHAYLGGHPELAEQVAQIGEDLDQVRQTTQRRRDRRR